MKQIIEEYGISLILWIIGMGILWNFNYMLRIVTGG